MAANIKRDYIVLSDGLGSGVNGPAFVQGDEIGPGDFEGGYDFDRLVNLGAVGKKSDQVPAAPTTLEDAQTLANQTGEPSFVQIPVSVHPDANVPQGEDSATPVNPESAA